MHTNRLLIRDLSRFRYLEDSISHRSSLRSYYQPQVYCDVKHRRCAHSCPPSFAERTLSLNGLVKRFGVLLVYKGLEFHVFFKRLAFSAQQCLAGVAEAIVEHLAADI